MKKAILHAKIDAELKRRLREEAEEQNRTLSNLVETALQDWLDGRCK